MVLKSHKFPFYNAKFAQTAKTGNVVSSSHTGYRRGKAREISVWCKNVAVLNFMRFNLCKLCHLEVLSRLIF